MKKRNWWIGLILGLIIIGGGCAKKAPPPPPPPPPLPTLKEIEAELKGRKILKFEVYSYAANRRREPFIPLVAKKQEKEKKKEVILSQGKEVEVIKIDSLRLSGIILDKKEQMAVFHDKVGFGYIFKKGKLFGQNHQIISNITGSVKDKKVILVENGEMRSFKLGEGIIGDKNTVLLTSLETDKNDLLNSMPLEKEVEVDKGDAFNTHF